MIEAALAIAVTVYGVAGALCSLLQRRRMSKRGSSQDVSLAFLFIVGFGYLLWLAYGLAIGNVPLIIVDAVGGAAIFATICLGVRLRLRARGCLRALRERRRGSVEYVGLPPQSPLGGHRR